MTATLPHSSIIDGIEEANLDLAGDALVGSSHVSPDEIIHTETTSSDHVWVVVEGHATIAQHGIAIDTAGPGDIIAAAPVFAFPHGTETVTARTDMTLLAFTGDGFRQLLERSPCLSRILTDQMARRLRTARTRLAGRDCRVGSGR